MSPPALTLKNVVVARGRAAVIIRDINCVIQAGEITAIVGPNGAGKSTLVQAVAGVLPYEGTISVYGRDPGALPPRERARIIAYLAQNSDVAWPMPVEGVIAIGRLPFLKAGLVLSREDRLAIARTLDRVGLTPLTERTVHSLSVGERARVLLARALVVEAGILLLDEPIAALDPRYQLETMEMLAEEARRGVAVVVVMHDLALAASYAQRIILMHEGRLVAAGPPRDVLTEKALIDVYGVRSANPSAGLSAHFKLINRETE